MDRKIQPGRRRRTGHRERGVVSIVVALSLAVLIGFVGLALDLGKLYVTKSELQNSADACALAAARDLTGAAPLSVSEAAGIAAALANSALFQSTPVAMTFDGKTTIASIEYSDSLDHPFEGRAAATTTYGLAKIHYVQCTTNLSGIVNWFIQALDVIPDVNIATPPVSPLPSAPTGPAHS